MVKRSALFWIGCFVVTASLIWVASSGLDSWAPHSLLERTKSSPALRKADRLPWPPAPDNYDNLYGNQQTVLSLKGDRHPWPPVPNNIYRQRHVATWSRKASLRTLLSTVLEPTIGTKYTVPPKPRMATARHRDPFERFSHDVVPNRRTQIVALKSSPFPYSGRVPYTNRPFLNISDRGQLGHKTVSGRSYWRNKTYNDPRTLLHIPKGFDIHNPGIMVVFFHGHGATLKRDILKRQRVPAQISKSGMNAVLVAPQFAVNARDSSAGKLWKPGGLRRFLNEASTKLAKMHGNQRTASLFRKMPVVIVAYSGGYVPAAWSVARGGLNSRLRGVVLMDGLYGHLDKFARWIGRSNAGFFVSAYAKSTRRKNQRLKKLLRQRNIKYATTLAPVLRPRTVTFVATDVRHRSFVTNAWTKNPISDLLVRVSHLAGPTQLRTSQLDAPSN